MKIKTAIYTKNAFTLAETLITLVIIGVMAVFTIQAVINSLAKRDAYSKLLKAVSAITSISNELRGNNGGDFTYLANNSTELLNLFKPKMNVMKLCSLGTDSPNCYLEDSAPVYNLHGDYLGGYTTYYFKGEPKIVTTDGTMYNFELLSPTCGGGNYTRNGVAENCGGVMVDINGTKPPNTAGKDLFFIQINKYNTIPAKGGWACDLTSTNAWNGVSCSMKAINEGGISYY